MGSNLTEPPRAVPRAAAGARARAAATSDTGCRPFLTLPREAERAIEWAEKGLRLSPFDPFAYGAWHGVAIARFRQTGYEHAADAARKAIQRNPGFSYPRVILAAALVNLGRIDEAKMEAARVLALQPGFSIAEFCAANDPAPEIAVRLSAALQEAGLPD